jgi:hypothetical protein
VHKTQPSSSHVVNRTKIEIAPDHPPSLGNHPGAERPSRPAGYGHAIGAPSIITGDAQRRAGPQSVGSIIGIKSASAITANASSCGTIPASTNNRAVRASDNRIVAPPRPASRPINPRTAAAAIK